MNCAQSSAVSQSGHRRNKNGKEHRTQMQPENANMLTLKVLVTTIDSQWEGMGDVGSPRYEPALFPPCPTIRVLSYSS